MSPIGKAALAAACLAVSHATAGPADVIRATASQSAPEGTWTFLVTVEHADEGWDHYADAWRVVAPDGQELARRTLFHPHVDEQPFTRSLAGVVIPAEIDRVVVEAHDSVHGWGGARVEVMLER